MRLSVLAFLLSALLLPVISSARTWYIQENGSGDAPTVQAGIDSAAIGDTVLVGPGTYFENINFNGKDIVTKSELGPDATILDGSSQKEAVVLLMNDESSAAVLEGFTITGGTGHIPVTSARGGGIYIRACSPTIRGNRFFNNHAEPNAWGGGIYIGSANDLSKLTSPIIEENIFEENHAVNGGGIALITGNVIIRKNQFLRNTCDYDGAGIFIWSGGGFQTITDNDFRENVARDHGGAILAAARLNAVGISITNNLFVRNNAFGLGGGDTGSGGAIWITEFSGIISHNTIVNNFGFGEAICGGGGITLDVTPAELSIYNNIIALNNSCGISCRDDIQSSLGVNLMWENVNGHLGTGIGVCPAEWSNSIIVADPYFCDVLSDDFTVAANSPALSNGSMGAFPEPGCGPVPVRSTTWGRLKDLYRN